MIETLKWGQPSWLPDRPRIGSTLRVFWHHNQPEHMALFVNCNNSIGQTMRELYPHAFTYSGNRALRFLMSAPLPHDAIAH